MVSVYISVSLSILFYPLTSRRAELDPGSPVLLSTKAHFSSLFRFGPYRPLPPCPPFLPLPSVTQVQPPFSHLLRLSHPSVRLFG